MLLLEIHTNYFHPPDDLLFISTRPSRPPYITLLVQISLYLVSWRSQRRTHQEPSDDILSVAVQCQHLRMARKGWLTSTPTLFRGIYLRGGEGRV